MSRKVFVEPEGEGAVLLVVDEGDLAHKLVARPKTYGELLTRQYLREEAPEASHSVTIDVGVADLSHPSGEVIGRAGYDVVLHVAGVSKEGK